MEGNIIRQTLVGASNGDTEFSHLITVVKLPTGVKEVIINTEDIKGKIAYLLKAYDVNMDLEANSNISIEGLLLIAK